MSEEAGGGPSEEAGGNPIYQGPARKQRLVNEIARDPWVDRAGGMRCATCRFYVQKVPSKVLSTAIVKEIGPCRRYAPTMQGFPVVFPADWCGEHKLDENRV